MATTESEHTAMASGATSPSEVLEFAAERAVEMVDLKFIDLPGTWQHMTLPLGALDAGDFESGLGFDGSSIRGFQEIHESDMLLMPDSSTAFIDPYYTRPTLSLICSVADPVLGEPYARDPRFVAHKAEQHLVATGIADVAYFGPEAEFFVFDHIAYEQVENRASYEVDSERGLLEHRGQPEAQPGIQAAPEGGLLPGAAGRLAREPAQRDGGDDGVARDPVRVPPPRGVLGRAGRDRHALPAAAADGRPDDDLQVRGQERRPRRRQDRHVHAQADLPGERVGHARPPVAVEGRRSADVRAGRVRAPERPGQALHRGPAHPRAGAAGVLRANHELLPAPCAGYEAPVNLVYSARNRSACVRVPMYHEAPKTKRVEFRSPDPAANPYLAFSALMMAGLDGIKRELDPGEPLDADIYELPEETLAKIATVPSSLEASLDALEADNSFLCEGDVFTPGLIEAYVRYKREEEVDAIRMRPHPWEFALYHDA